MNSLSSRAASFFDRKALQEIIQSIIAPVIAGLAALLWLYSLVKSEPPKTLVFPLSSILLTGLYFISGPVYAGVLLAFLSIVGLVGIFVTFDTVPRLLFLAETIMLWLLFFVLENYRESRQAQRGRIREEEETLETNSSLLESRIEEHKSRCINLTQRISNYQLLGRMIQIMGSTLDETKLTAVLEELTSNFIGKGSWKIKKGAQNDVFAQYIKNTNLPLIVQDLARDNRFFVKNPRFSSLIAVPLELNGKYWGTIKGMALQPGVFDEADLRLLSVLGGIASLAFNNAKLYHKTQELAITDSLTGLYVNSYFKERLTQEFFRSKNHRQPLSVAILDVDYFKNINDTYGHPVGDVILRQISSLLRRRLRETDFLSRYGGEEFGIIMPQTELHEAVLVVENIRMHIADERFFLPVESFQPVQVRITASVGLSTLAAGMKTPDEILRQADAALYHAKNTGRNRTEIS